MTMLGAEFPGAGLWSTTGHGLPSPPPGLSPKVAEQLPGASGLAPTPTSRGTQVKAKTTCPYTCQCTCCGYDFCAKCCCPCTFCRCCCWSCVAVVLFVVAIGLVAVALWKTLHPKLPNYNVQNVNFIFNVTGGSGNSSVLNTQMLFQIVTTNPNTKIGILYDQITLNVQLLGIAVGNQIISKFFSGYNVTKYINVNMTSGPVILSTANQAALASAVSAGSVPLNLDMDVKAQITLGLLKTPQLQLDLTCVVTVDPGITSGSQITGMTCKFKFKL